MLKLNAIAPEGLERLPSDRYRVVEDGSEFDAVLVRSRDLHSMEFPSSLAAVARAGAGVNNIPVEAMSRRGVPVFNTPGANASAVKELVITALLATARNVLPAWDYVRDLDLDGDALREAVEAGKKRFVGFEITSRTLGVVGLGAVGVQVANAARSLGMRVVGFDPHLSVRRALELSSEVEQAASLEALFGRCDVVSLHVPLLGETRGMVDAELLARLPKGAYLLNFARGPIVEETAVLDALGGGRLAGYVCDFPSRPLLDHPKVLALPHLGASTREAEVNCAVRAAETLRGYLEHGNVRDSVSFPAAELPRLDAHRITLANANVPNMVGQISTCLGEAGLNIVDLLNKSRGELAYTVVDLDEAPDEATLRHLRDIEGVLCLRDLARPNQSSSGLA